MAEPQLSAEQLFGEALDLPPEHRSAFLDQACRDAPELRRLVEVLLDDNQRMGSFLAEPLLMPGGISSHSPSTVGLPLARFQPSQLIAGRFFVVRFIARGGMGEVYEAKDQFLQDASIALKIIRPEIAANAATSSRFEQEVILARKVVHPNLCPIYEIYHCEQPAPPFLFLTMKLLEGQTLDARLKARPRISASEAVEICSQLISGVSALHAAGIIHRDLKPNNVMLEQTGQRLNLSIMDFGLARLHQAESTLLGTGMIAGTPGYMAPELLRGERPTKSTDLFALGIVLHQVLTGERPIESERGLSVTPAPTLRSTQAPAELVHAVENFLSTDPERRSSAFERVRPSQDGATPSAAFKRSSRLLNKGKWYWAGGVLAVIALAVAILVTPASVSGPIDSAQLTSSAEPKEGPLFTDGLRLYFASGGVPSQMAVRGGIIAPVPQVVTGMRLMNISADGARVLEWKAQPGDDIGRGSLWVASSLGGAPRRLGDFLVNSPDWASAAFSPDDQAIVFTDKRTLYSADASGGNVRKLWEAPMSMDGVCFSPDGKELTVALWDSKSPSHLWRLKASGEGPHPLLADWPSDAEQWNPQWTPDGRHFIFTSAREGRPNIYELVTPRWFELWKKASAVRITGNQIPILASAPARDSTRLFVLAKADQAEMEALDPRTGRFEPFLGGLAAGEFVISPDRQWMAYTEFPTWHLWKSKLDGSQAVQLTDSKGDSMRWSPDGKWLVYTDNFKLNLISAEGGTPEKLIPTGDHEMAPDWSPDGKSISFTYFNFTDQPAGGIYTVDLATRKVSITPNTEGFLGAQWSPDGRYRVAFVEPNRVMLYSTDTGKWKVLKQFQETWAGDLWSRDSKFLYVTMVDVQKGLFKLTVPDGKWEKVSDLVGMNAGKDRSSLSLTADGEPAIMITTGVAQIYSLQWKH